IASHTTRRPELRRASHPPPRGAAETISTAAHAPWPGGLPSSSTGGMSRSDCVSCMRRHLPGGGLGGGPGAAAPRPGGRRGGGGERAAWSEGLGVKGQGWTAGSAGRFGVSAAPPADFTTERCPSIAVRNHAPSGDGLLGGVVMKVSPVPQVAPYGRDQGEAA